MKPSPVIQLITIFFGMSAIYSGITYLLSTGIFTIAGIFESNSYYSGGTNLYMLVIMILLGLLGLFLIAKSNDIATFITQKSGYSNSLNIKTENRELLCIFIVFLSLGHLLKHVPYFLNDVLSFFTFNAQKSGLLESPRAEKINWIANFLQILIPLLMIIFCRNLSNYFGKNIAMEGKFEMDEPQQIDVTKEEN